jgi:aryl-alcohol dehydrogenase-like predicted oxidoreductase
VKLALGTVQFGLDYGAFGESTRPDLASVAATLDRAQLAGIDTLDTAAAYGQSEAVLGELECANRFAIVSKIPSLKGSADPYVEAKQHITSSLAALKTNQLYGMMAHSADDLLGANQDAIWQAMAESKASGQVKRIGVSVYTPEQADAIIALYPIEIIQLPFNVFDQRASTSGLFGRLQAAGVEVHVRSVFLQGLLLSEAGHIPQGLQSAVPLLDRFEALCIETGCSKLAAALGFVRQQKAVGKIVVGVRNAKELDEILVAWDENPVLPDFSTLASDDMQLINPANWPVNGNAS